MNPWLKTSSGFPRIATTSSPCVSIASPQVASQRGQVRMWVSVTVATSLTGSLRHAGPPARLRAVNLFLIGFSDEGALTREDTAEALVPLVEQLPFFQRAEVRTWCSPTGTAAAATVSHPLDQTGGVEY